MAMPRFFKVPKHQKFEYRPRYWDPDKEKMDARLKRNKKTQLSEKEARKIRMTSGFRARYSTDKFNQSKAIRRSNLIRLAVFILIMAISIIVLSEKILKFVQLIEGTGTQ